MFLPETVHFGRKGMLQRLCARIRLNLLFICRWLRRRLGEILQKRGPILKAVANLHSRKTMTAVLMNDEPRSVPRPREIYTLDFGSVGALIKRIRKLRGLTQQEVANASGINHTHLSKIEAGKAEPSDNVKASSR